MTTPFRRARFVAALAFTLGAFAIVEPSVAIAQNAPLDPAALVAPRLLENVEPVYPESQKAAAVKATVHLTLTLDAMGKVTEAVVATSGGPDFDGAALEAAKRLVFSPASKGGKPIPSKIPFRFDFAYEAPPPPVAVDVAPKTAAVPKVGVLKGLVKTPTEEPLPGAQVTLTRVGGGKGEDGKSVVVAQVSTDAKGAFVFPPLPAGQYHVEVVAEGFDRYAVDEDVAPDVESSVVYRTALAPSTDGVVDVIVKGEKPPREVTRRTMEREEILKAPGTGGDALRSLENMPGVARPPGLMGLLIVRGSAPTDTLVLVDGTEIPIAYHFGGLTSVIPTEMLERIDFYPGNFGVEYGRVMGGMVDVGIRSPKKDGYHGLFQIDLIDARLMAEGPITEKTRFLVGARRSWLDAWLPGVLRKTGADVTAAPVYYDWQAVLEHDISDKTTGRLLFMGSDDRLELILNSASESDPGFGGDIGNRTKFWRLQARFDTKASEAVRAINTVSIGHDGVFFNFGDRFLNLDLHPISARSDLRAKLSKEITCIAGLDLNFTPYDVSYKFPPFRQDGVIDGPTFARQANLISGKSTLFRPGAYVMLDLAPVKGLKLLPGVRVDYSQDTASWTADPRFAARFDIVREYPRTTLKGGVGLFHQPPQPQESLVPFGNKGLHSNQAIHYSLGFEQELSRHVEISMEGFYKDLRSLVIQEAAESSSANGVKYVNKGVGRIYGGEALIRWKPDGQFFGWLAFTLSRSERKDDPSQSYQLFQYDQTHILTALGSYKLGRGWELGMRFRYVTGSPDTAYLGGLVDYDAGAYNPNQGPRWGTRLGSYHTLDVRVEKTWQFSTWKLSAYLDLRNAYNHKNPEAVSYNYDYTQSKSVAGLPILPVFGVRGEL